MRFAGSIHAVGVAHYLAKMTPHVVVTDIRMPPTGTDEGIRAAAALRPGESALHGRLGLMLERQRRYRDAVGAYTRAARLDATGGRWRARRHVG